MYRTNRKSVNHFFLHCKNIDCSLLEVQKWYQRNNVNFVEVSDRVIVGFVPNEENEEWHVTNGMTSCKVKKTGKRIVSTWCYTYARVYTYGCGAEFHKWPLVEIPLHFIWTINHKQSANHRNPVLSLLLSSKSWLHKFCKVSDIQFHIFLLNDWPRGRTFLLLVELKFSRQCCCNVKQEESYFLALE